MYQDRTIYKNFQSRLEKFSHRFKDSSTDEAESKLQLELAEWYFENKHYATGYYTLVEAIITYACEVSDKKSMLRSDRYAMKNLLAKATEQYTDLAKLFIEVNQAKQEIDRALQNKQVEKYQKAISPLHSYIRQAKSIFASGGLNARTSASVSNN